MSKCCVSRSSLEETGCVCVSPLDVTVKNGGGGCGCGVEYTGIKAVHFVYLSIFQGGGDISGLAEREVIRIQHGDHKIMNSIW